MTWFLVIADTNQPIATQALPKVWIRITATGGDAAKKDVEDIVSRASGWEFEVPQTELNAILVKLSDLIEDVPA